MAVKGGGSVVECNRLAQLALGRTAILTYFLCTQTHADRSDRRHYHTAFAGKANKCAL